jgi:hypothetical protein
MERQVLRVAGRRFLLPDGSERYLVDEELLQRFTAELGGQLADPLKLASPSSRAVEGFRRAG